MSAERVNPFAIPEVAPQFDVKPKAPKPDMANHIEQLAKDNNFPSRQASRAATVEVKTAPKRRRTHTTGRNQQLNIKVTVATVERFYALADKKGIPLCELLEQALDALDLKESR